MDQEPQKEAEKKSSLVKKVLKILLPLLLGVVVLWLLYRKTDFSDMWDRIKDANFAILLSALIFGLVGNVFRGMRWKLLIQPLGYNPPASDLVYAVFGNYAVNFILPRAGEVWRCGVISKYDKIPFVKLIGTLLVDRVFDTLMVLLITLLACCFNLDFFLNYIRNNQALSDIVSRTFSSYWLYLGLLLIVAALYVMFGLFGNTSFVKKIKGFFKELGSDLKSVAKMDQKGLFIFYTIAIWVCYFLYFYINFFAFDFTKNLGITVGLITFAISSLSMAIPTNGGMGVWHAAVMLSLGIYGVSKPSAEAFAFGVFALQSFWVVLYGTFGIFALSIKNRRK